MKEKRRLGDKEVKVLEDIKKLLVLQLLNAGVQGSVFADLLGIDLGRLQQNFLNQEAIQRKVNVQTNTSTR
jgi:hypothetical protein